MRHSFFLVKIRLNLVDEGGLMRKFFIFIKESGEIH